MYTELENVIAINVENKGLQLRALDVGFKVEGLYAPEKKEHFGKGGGPIQGETTCKLSPELEELFNEVTGRNATGAPSDNYYL